MKNIFSQFFAAESFDGLMVKVLVKCAIRFYISLVRICEFCTQISHPLAYGVRFSSKARVTTDYHRSPQHANDHEVTLSHLLRDNQAGHCDKQQEQRQSDFI